MSQDQSPHRVIAVNAAVIRLAGRDQQPAVSLALSRQLARFHWELG